MYLVKASKVALLVNTGTVAVFSSTKEKVNHIALTLLEFKLVYYRTSAAF